MTRNFRWTILTLAAGLGLWWAAAPLLASQPIAKQENVACTVCHDKPGSKLMTDRGKYYEARGTLEGYDDIVEVFGKCTTCHDKRPGSLKLTRTGRRFLKVVHDMDGLSAWMETTHPTGPFDEEAYLELLGDDETTAEPAGVR